MYKLIRPILFMMQPEEAHHFTFNFIKLIHKIPGVKSLIRALYYPKAKNLGVEIAGIHFPNRVGLAAGFDKDAKLFDELHNFGLGHIEIGTVTPLPQPGNEQPRMFRLPKDKGIINRMGFNNQGAGPAATRLSFKKSKDLIIGGNIGKNKITPNEDATSDYVKCFHELFDYVDYFTVNVSSPNTPGLRALQEKGPLLELLSTLKKEALAKDIYKPIFLKIAPDLTDTQLDEIVEIIIESKIDGLIATNTTISREYLVSDESLKSQTGGLSGAPLTQRSTEVVRYIHQKSGGRFPIIAVGGIMTAADAMAKFDAGASMVQLYSGFIYAGPKLISDIHKACQQRFS